MQNANPLDQLRDIHLPAEISWWPLAYGWWLSLLLLLLLITAGIFVLRHYLKTNQYRRLAQLKLDTLYSHYTNETEFLKQVARLLKQVCIHYVDAKSAKLHSKDWLQFLSTRCPGLNQQSFETICMQQYQANCEVNKEQLYKDAKYWLKKHRKTPC